MTRQRLLELLARFPKLHITVAGDLFLDRWYEIDESLNEPSVETGLTAYQVVRKRSAAGAAGTVLNNLSELGVGEIEAVSMLGDDGDGWEMLQRLKQRRVDTAGVVQTDRVVTPSYIKPLFPKEGNRFDIKNFTPTPRDLQRELLTRIKAALVRSDALMLLDQVCETDTGVLTAYVRDGVAELAQRYPNKLIFADSRLFIQHFRNVVIKCNNLEAARMAGREATEERFDEREVFECMDALHAHTARPVVITCNRHGVAVEENGRKLLVPAAKQNGPIDVCGAGDACTAGLVSTLCAGGSYAEAAFVGNLTSGVTVRKLGRTGTASPQELLALYDEQWEG